MGGTGEVSTISKREMDEAQVQDNNFRFFDLGYSTHVQIFSFVK
jgi:hypothetical protein